MKKTLLVTALVASVASMAATKGFVEVGNNNETKVSTFKDGLTSKLSAKTEVSVLNTGLTVGGQLNFGGVQLTKETPLSEKGKVDGNLWAKYDLPEFGKFKSNVKATYTGSKDLKTGDPKKENKIALEANGTYEVLENVKLGAKSVTRFELAKAHDAKTVTSDHTLTLDASYGDVKDIKGFVNIGHNYMPATQAYVEAGASAAYKGIKDLELTGKFDFGHKGSAESVKSKQDGLFEFAGVEYYHAYVLGAKYTGVKGLELGAKAYVESHKGGTYTVKGVGETKDAEKSTTGINAVWGLAPTLTYKAIENLTITSNNRFEMAYLSEYGKVKAEAAGAQAPGNGSASAPSVQSAPASGGAQQQNRNKTFYANVKLHAGVKYDYKGLDKLTLTPSFDTTFTTGNIQVGKLEDDKVLTNRAFNPSLTLTPKFAVAYKPIESVELKGDLGADVKFGLDTSGKKFEYKDTTLKLNLSTKYSW